MRTNALHSLVTAAALVQAASFAATPLVNHSDTWRYHKGTNAPQAGWQSIADAALDATWASGKGGIGYADNANETSLCQTLLNDMRNSYTTVYLRRSFQVADTVDPD